MPLKCFQVLLAMHATYGGGRQSSATFLPDISGSCFLAEHGNDVAAPEYPSAQEMRYQYASPKLHKARALLLLPCSSLA